MRIRVAIALLALAPAVVGAQERGALPDLPSEVEDRVRRMRTDDAALHLAGPVTIPADSVVRSDLTVEGGSLHLAGRVTGDVLVTGGDLVLGENAIVDGDVLVVGGEIHGIEAAQVGGTLLAYGAARDVVRRDRDRPRRHRDHEKDEDEDEEDDDWRRHRHDDDDDGGLDVGVSVAGNYNRVEGLPIMFGPIIETGGPNRLHIAGQAIWRTHPSVRWSTRSATRCGSTRACSATGCAWVATLARWSGPSSDAG